MVSNPPYRSSDHQKVDLNTGRQGTFQDGNVFTWTIQRNAQSLAFATECGDAKNNFQSYRVFKDDHHVVWKQDGWEYKTIYWCQ